jgi:hypothetical protein
VLDSGRALTSPAASADGVDSSPSKTRWRNDAADLPELGIANDAKDPASPRPVFVRACVWAGDWELGCDDSVYRPDGKETPIVRTFVESNPGAT